MGNDGLLITAGLDGSINAWAGHELQSNNPSVLAEADVPQSRGSIDLTEQVRMHACTCEAGNGHPARAIIDTEAAAMRAHSFMPLLYTSPTCHGMQAAGCRPFRLMPMLLQRCWACLIPCGVTCRR